MKIHVSDIGDNSVGIQEGEEIMKYCAGDVRATLRMYANKSKLNSSLFGEEEHSEKPSVVDILSGNVSMEQVPVKIVNVIGAKTRR